MVMVIFFLYVYSKCNTIYVNGDANKLLLLLLVAIAYGKGVILNEPYDKMNGKFFADFIRQHFNLCFGRAGTKRDGKSVFIMDNDPSQVSKLAMNALREIECELSKIPSRSPDLNPCM